MHPYEKIAKILRTDKDFLIKAEERLSAVTSKKNILERIVKENEEQIKDRLFELGIPKDTGPAEIHDALISKIEADDNKLFEALGRPICRRREDCERVVGQALKIANPAKGFFLKKEKAAEFLLRQPPKKILQYLRYQNVEELIAKEDIFEVYSGLRFIEGEDWLNEVFFSQYAGLTPDDFEEREVRAIVLDSKWAAAGESFVKKKWHNISHLKELGIVFFVPLVLNISGELLRNLSLVLHYLHEIPFYSDLFKKSAETPTTFSSNIISLLRGDVFDRRLAEAEKSLWLVIQQYLAKKDENDWRLFAPHINPEALHWFKAERDLVKFGEINDGFGKDLRFWLDLDWVGDYFKDSAGNDILVSFNLVDAAMSLVKEQEMIKYLYHHQEALWNKIFIEYFSLAELENFSKNYLLQGYFEI